MSRAHVNEVGGGETLSVTSLATAILPPLEEQATLREGCCRQSVKTIKNMPVLESTGFIPQVFPLVILMTLFFVLNAKIFLPTLGQIFAVRKQSSFTLSNMTTAPSVTTSSLKTSIFSSPGSLEGKSLKAGSSLHSVLQTQFSKNVNPSLLSEQKLSDDSKKLQDLISYKVK